ncbi:MAG: hypothetical protein K2X69_09160 [Silvanigrellaceae bacterium]|nr:hypothetical protein [Silvanigrellaceae bacterium]
MNDIKEINSKQVQNYLNQKSEACKDLEKIYCSVRNIFKKDPLYLFLRRDPDDGSDTLCLYIRKQRFSKEENEILINKICNEIPENFIVKFIYSDPSAA